MNQYNQYIHIREYYVAIKGKEDPDICYNTDESHTHYIVNEKPLQVKTIYCMILLIKCPEKANVKSQNTDKQLPVADSGSKDWLQISSRKFWG